MTALEAPRGAPRRELPRLAGQVRADVCVVGLGITGLTALGRLLDRSRRRRVVGIDAVGVGGGSARAGALDPVDELLVAARPGTTFGKGAPTEADRWLLEARIEARERLLAEAPGAERRGSLRWASSETPGADGDDSVDRGDGLFSPTALCRSVAHAIAGRCELYAGAEVVDVEPERVRTAGGEVRAEVVVVCVSELSPLWPELSGRVRRHRETRGTSAPALDVDLPQVVLDASRGARWWQWTDRRIGVATTRPAEEPPDAIDLTAIMRDCVGSRATLTPSPVIEHEDVDGGLWADEAPRGPGLFAAAGHGSCALLATLAAEALADLAAGARTPRLVEAIRARAAPPDARP